MYNICVRKNTKLMNKTKELNKWKGTPQSWIGRLN